MGLLQGTSTYLIGAVDHAEDPRKWRKEIANELLLPLGVRVYDPLVKPTWFDEYPLAETSYGEIKLFREHLIDPENTKFNHRLINSRMSQIRDFCLRMANSCDFIIGVLPKKFTVGTLEELSAAAAAKKPILFYLPDGMDTSTWLPAQIGESFYDNTFTTMEELYNRVRAIDSGDAKVNNLDWIFLSYFNDEVIKNEFPDYQQTRD